MSEMPSFDIGLGVGMPTSIYSGRTADMDYGYRLTITLLRHWATNHLSDETNDFLRCVADDLERNVDLVVPPFAAQIIELTGGSNND